MSKDKQGVEIMSQNKMKKIKMTQLLDSRDVQLILLNLVDFATSIYESGEFGIQNGSDEAHNLIFSKQLIMLDRLTVAQWICRGSPERRARDAIKDYVDEVKRMKKIQKEEKIVIAKVFGGKR